MRRREWLFLLSQLRFREARICTQETCDIVKRMSSPLDYSRDSVSRYKKRKARFTFCEVLTLLGEVKRHRTLVVGKFNRGVPADLKKRTWAEITARVNRISQCKREVIEVIKKWSDLKCDTTRKVASMRYGTAPARGLTSRLSCNLTYTEKAVSRILEMDNKRNEGYEPFEVNDDDDEGPEEADDSDAEDIIEIPSSPTEGPSMSPHSHHSANYASVTKDHLQTPHHSGSSWNSPQSSFETHYDYTRPLSAASSDESNYDNQRDEQPSSPTVNPKDDTAVSPNARDSVLQSATSSLQEQYASNKLLEAVSRSLELLSESVQQLAETQREFVYKSLQLQRDTVNVLRELSGGACALMHDRLQGGAALM